MTKQLWWPRHYSQWTRLYRQPQLFTVITSRDGKTGRRKTIRVRARSAREAAGIVGQRHDTWISRVWLPA